MHGPLVLACVAALGSAAAAPAAPEAPAGLELMWEAPASCPTATAVRRSIATLVGEGAEDRSAAARATVTAGEAGWALNLEIRAGTVAERRALEAGECGALADAAALLIAIALDPLAVTQRVTSVQWRASAPGQQEAGADDAGAGEDVVPEPPAEEDASPAPTTVAPEPTARSDDAGPSVVRAQAQPRRRRRVDARFALRPWGGGSFGVLPTFGGTVGATAGLIVRWMRVELGGGYWFGGSETSTPRPNVGGDFDLWALSLRGCPTPTAGPVEFPLCVGLEAGSMGGSGKGADVVRDADSAWVAVQLAPALAWTAARRVSLWISAEVVVALRRPRFHVDGLGEIYRAGPAGLRPLVGLEVRLP